MDLTLLSAMNAARAARRAVVLATDLATGAGELLFAEDLATAPRAGTALGEAAAEAMRKGRSGLAEIEGRRVFLTVSAPPVRVVAIGAVHISQAMVPFCRELGFDLTVIDPRTAFATPERFPGITLLAQWPDEALKSVPLDRYTAFVALTHDPKIDDPGLVAALRSECFSIGALGSRKTHARRVERLTAAGFGSETIARIHAPIGLDIGAMSPAEIALSIVGEIVADLRRDHAAERAKARQARGAAA